MYSLTKRAFSDGQYTITRKSPTLWQVDIEGPLGARAGMAFVEWLNELYSIHGATQHVILNAANIGPIDLEVLQKLIAILHNEQLSGLAIYGGAIAERNFQGLLLLMQGNKRAAFFGNANDALKFLQALQTAKPAPTPADKTSEKTESTPTLT